MDEARIDAPYVVTLWRRDTHGGPQTRAARVTVANLSDFPADLGVPGEDWCGLQWDVSREGVARRSAGPVGMPDAIDHDYDHADRHGRPHGPAPHRRPPHPAPRRRRRRRRPPPRHPATSTTTYPTPTSSRAYYDRIRAADAWQYAYHRATPAVWVEYLNRTIPAAATRRDAS